jgi:hypothetical protein
VYYTDPGIRGVPAVPVGTYLNTNTPLTSCAANPAPCPASGPGQERIEVSLPDITAAGEYRLRAWNYQTGFADQDLRVFFSAPA